MSVGSITYSTNSIPFLIARTEGGFINALAIPQVEEITSPGVDGRRWRTIYDQYPPFDLYTVVDAFNYEAATSIKSKAELLTNRLCRLAVTVDGIGYAQKDVHVNSVRAVCYPGPAAGNGGSGSAHLVIVFNCVLTTFE